jgi:hypothetical protein
MKSSARLETFPVSNSDTVSSVYYPRQLRKVNLFGHSVYVQWPAAVIYLLMKESETGQPLGFRESENSDFVPFGFDDTQYDRGLKRKQYRKRT